MTLDQIETTAMLMGWYWVGRAPFRQHDLGYLYGLRKDGEEYYTFERSRHTHLDRSAALLPDRRPENRRIRERLLTAWSEDHDIRPD
jgi:hypothetical protein